MFDSGIFSSIPAAVLSFFSLIYILVAQPVKIAGMAMEPNFRADQYYFVEKSAYRQIGPQRGDVIVHRSPQDKGTQLIKRVVGLPGETIGFRDGGAWINNKKLEEPYLTAGTRTASGEFFSEGEKVVPRDSYVVLGDNRSHSVDSRNFGFVGKELIIGRVGKCYKGC